MEDIISLLVGIIIGGIATYYRVTQSQQVNLVKDYESQIDDLNEKHQVALKEARNRSIDGSRAVIKGKLAEQFAPILPDFKYLPSDARFLGDPIDYIVFNGYTNLKDNGDITSDLEIVILDIKTGQSALSPFQQAIAKAVKAGRVRFEVIRPEIPEESPAKEVPARFPPVIHQEQVTPYRIQQIRKTYARAYEPWTSEDDQLLTQLYRQNMEIQDLAAKFDRNPGAIRSRLSKLGLKPIVYSTD